MKILFSTLLIIGWLAFLAGCSTEPEPITIENKIDITGFYADWSNGLELWVYQDYADPQKLRYEVQIRWWQVTTKLDGLIDRQERKLIASGNYQAVQNVSLNLWYGGDPLELAGTFYYNLTTNMDVRFVFQHSLEKLNFHSQGAISNNNY